MQIVSVLWRDCRKFLVDLFNLKEYRNLLIADVAELVDAPDLGSGAARRGGSSPFIRTMKFKFIGILRQKMVASSLPFIAIRRG